jgi:inner membrane protein
MIHNILSRPELFWFFIGLILFLFELFTPGFFIFFFGLGAWVTALICLIGEPGINLQIIIFAVVSVLSLVGLRKIIKKKLFYNKESASDEIEDEFTGKDALAKTDFGPDTLGKVEFKGTDWKSKSTSEIKEGQIVVIVEKENFTLLVKPKKQ